MREHSAFRDIEQQALAQANEKHSGLERESGNWSASVGCSCPILVSMRKGSGQPVHPPIRGGKRPWHTLLCHRHPICLQHTAVFCFAILTASFFFEAVMRWFHW